MSIKSAVYDGRTALVRVDAGGERIEGWAHQLSESVRALNHLTRDQSVPAPEVYELLGDLALAANMLPQLMAQLAAGLAGSLEDYDVYDSARDPQVSVSTAREHLEAAAVCAAHVGDALDRARAAIADQGYTVPPNR